ncbi:MAG: ferredoxin [Deltaproteobacteria bacterium]|nr:ferredoxin [Deltaproteobacteria bacterium]
MSEVARARADGWTAGSGIELVNCAERTICGVGAVATAAAAGGRALAGRRAATLLSAGPATGGTVIDSGAWVDHRIRAPRPPAGFAFELLAGNGQEAVDHCLVAHRLTSMLGLPGLCELDRKSAEGLHVVKLPDEAVIAELLSVPAGRLGSSDEEIVKAATEVFREVAAKTGRAVGAVVGYQVADAEHVIVTGGVNGAAMMAAGRLRLTGVKCGVLAISLVRPFPRAQLAGLVKERRGVVVLMDPADPGFAEGIQALTKAKVASISAADLDNQSSLRAALGLPAAAPAIVHEVSVQVGVAPKGRWIESRLLAAIARARALGTFSVDEVACAGARGISIGPGRTRPPTELDLLVAADASALDPNGPISGLKVGGTLLLLGGVDRRPAALAQRIAEKQLSLAGFDGSALAAAAPEALDAMVEGAILAAIPRFDSVLPGVSQPVAALAQHADLRERAPLLEGAAMLASREKSSHGEPSKRRSARARMPAPAVETGRARAELRNFFVTGRGKKLVAEPLPASPLNPLPAEGLFRSRASYDPYPLFLSETDGPEPLRTWLSKLVQDVSASTIDEHLDLLVRIVARGLAQGLSPVGQLGAAFAEFAAGFDLSAPARAALDDEIQKLSSKLPKTGQLVPLGEATLAHLYARALSRAREAPREAFLVEVKKLESKLSDMLATDDGLAPATASSLAAALGSNDGSGSYVDPAKLASLLPSTKGSRRLPEDRRRRVEAARKTLASYVQGGRDNRTVIVSSRTLPSSAAMALAGARVIEHGDPAAVASGVFDGIAESMIELFRAVRVARLEVVGAYEPGLHDETLARLDWRSFTDQELRVAPAVVVMEEEHHLREDALASFSRLLRSGRPVQLVVTLRAAPPVDDGFHPGLGYLAVAHREALVLQSTVGAPEHLSAGLDRMAKSLRPAVCLVATPSWPVHGWLELAAAHASRVTPCFLYDPEAGASWAERFDLSGNPDPEARWPVREVEIDADGNARTRACAFTYADAAALDPEQRRHFRLIPPESWDEDQVEVSEYLTTVDGSWTPRVPYIWVVDDDGLLHRALVSRALALAARDHMRAWKILQELGGTNNEHARRAAERARAEARLEAEDQRKALVLEHEAELERVRNGAASDAMRRLVEVLMDLDSAPAARREPKTAQPAAAPEPAEPAKVAKVAPVAAEEETASFEGPYIDEALCTTCNECTNLNPLMFKYNANRQATVADRTAGTFLQLVSAAEKCPARCIHPGAPDAGDATANDDLVARARKFN